MAKRILLLPGWMTGLRLYGKRENFSIQIGKREAENKDDEIVGLSLGALVALRDCNHNNKLILVNPPLPRRNIFIWLIRWCRYILAEGLFLERQKFIKNPFRYALEVIKCIKILRIDFSEKLDNIPKNNLVVIRGKSDNFFCDEDAVRFIQSKGFRVIEIENCGHNWCEQIENVIIESTSITGQNIFVDGGYNLK